MVLFCTAEEVEVSSQLDAVSKGLVGTQYGLNNMSPQMCSSYQDELDFSGFEALSWLNTSNDKKVTNLSTLKVRLHFFRILSTSKTSKLSVQTAVYSQTSVVISGTNKRLCLLYAKQLDSRCEMNHASL